MDTILFVGLNVGVQDTMEYLKQHWQEIAEEAKWVQQYVQPMDMTRTADWGDYNVQSDITKHWIRGWTADPGWLNFGIIYQGQWIPYGCEKCPNTVVALQEIAKEYPIAVAGYSWLRPKSSIPPHTDKNPGEITVHLGLDVPENCVLFADGKPLFHRNGEILSFDSNKTHSAVNGSDKDRIVLYLLLKK